MQIMSTHVANIKIQALKVGILVRGNSQKAGRTVGCCIRSRLVSIESLCDAAG